MPTLRHTLQQSLDGWRNQLHESWLDLLGDTKPAFSQIDCEENFDEDHPVLPTFQGDHSRIFRAFDELTPTDVKVVLIGEDPYPCISRATGRAFEQGDLNAWVPTANGQPVIHCARSLQSIVQQLATFRTRDPLYSCSRGGWNVLKEHVGPNGRLHNSFPTPPEVFDLWHSEGVLLLNAALTFTKKSQKQHHFHLWKPFVQKVISSLACRQEATVFMCFGTKAWNVLGSCVRSSLISRDLIVRRKHPTVKHCFLAGCNVFEDANSKLMAAGRNQVNF